MEKAIVQIQNLLLLTSEEVYNMIVSAMEGGSNYWYEVENADELKFATVSMKGEPFVDRMLVAMEKGIEIKFNDLEEDGKPAKFALTFDRIREAEKLMMKNHRRHLGDVLAENDDAITADVFFQLCILGEVIYG